MKDRDVETRPGDDYQTELESEPLEGTDETRRIVMPRKADVSRSDQARRTRPSRTSATPSGPANSIPAATPAATRLRGSGDPKWSATQTRPIGETEPATQARQVAEPADAPIRLTAAHPLARIRRESRGRSLSQSLGLGGPRASRLGSASLGAFSPRLGRPSMRGVFGLASLTATFAVVAALLVTLPSHPSGPAATGSVYSIDWHNATKPPFTKLDFGPYFTTLDNQLLMVATTGSTTTVWATTDGSTWTQRSGSGAFGIDGRRFVAQGFSDDGQGGLVVIGNSLGSSATDVEATAWHSRDGTSWTSMQVQSGGGQEMVAGVVSRAGAAVAAGNGVAWLSTDGVTWSPQVLPGESTAAGSYTPRAVTAWSGGFVIVGLWTGSATTRSAAWYSADGRDWKQAKTSLDGFDVRGMASLNGTVVAVGTDLGADAPGLAASWSSTDGNTWTKTTAPTDLATVGMDGVVNVDGSLVAFGAPAPGTSTAAPQAGPTLPGSTPQPVVTEAVWVSENGFDWLPIANAALPLTRAHVAALGNRVVMIGGSSSSASSNGASSSGASGSAGSSIGTSSSDLAVVSGDLVLGPARPPASQSAPPANFALAVQAGVAPMIVDVTKDFTLGPIATSDDRFFLFATGPTGTSIFSSPDGSLWSQELEPQGLTLSVVTAQPAASSAASHAAASSAASHAAASNPASQPASSGAPGQPVIIGRPVVLQAIPDGQGGIIAAGKVTNGSGDNGMIWHMTKAGGWKQALFQDDTPPEFSSIVAGPGGFVASSDVAGGSQIVYSTDGGSWPARSIAVGNGFALSVATYHYGYVAVGTDPNRQGATTAWTSPDGRTWTMRTDWHLPANVTSLFGMGTTLVAAANTATPTGSASATAHAAASASAKPTPTPKPTPTKAPTAAAPSSTWWWSATGVVWQQSGLQTSGGDWAIANNGLLVLSAPATPTGSWPAWSSSDGRSWTQSGSSAINFAGSGTICSIDSLGSRIIIVGWEGPGSLKGYFGRFASQ